MRLIRNTYLVLFLLLSIESAAQLTDLKVPKNFKKIDLSFEYVNNFIILEAKFMENFPMKFIFDTGAEHTIITKKEIIDILQFKYEKRFTIIGSDMSTELYAYLIRGVNLSFKNLKAINRSVLVLEDDYFRFEEFAGINVQGIIGADFFSRFVVKIDYNRKVITLTNPEHFKPPSKNVLTVPIEIKRHKPYLGAQTNFNKDSTVQVKLLLDTGASLALLLHTNTHPHLQLPAKTITTNIGMGMGGYIEGFIGRIQSLSFADVSFPEVATSFQDIVTEMDTSYLNGRNGILGNKILSRFTITIDYVRNTLFLSPNKDINKKFRFDKSGMLVAAAGINLNRFTVFGVIADSPAARAGILPGDEIRVLNGVPASFLTLEGISRKLQGKTGKRMRLKLKRDRKRIKKEFFLENLI